MRTRILTRGRRGERGSAMIEAAISLSFFLAVLFGIEEFGRAMFAYNQLSYLSHLGARYASVRGSTASTPATVDSIQTYVRSKAVGLSGLQVTTTWQNGSNLPGHWVQVRASYTLGFVAPYMPGRSLSMSSTSQNNILQ